MEECLGEWSEGKRERETKGEKEDERGEERAAEMEAVRRREEKMVENPPLSVPMDR